MIPFETLSVEEKILLLNEESKTPLLSPLTTAKKVLIVDDNQINRMVLRAFLEKSGYECFCANDGIEALEAFDKQKFSIILMDIVMPNMDGLVATQEIRKRENVSEQLRTPIIGISANVLVKDKKEARQKGMSQDGTTFQATRGTGGLGPTGGRLWDPPPAAAGFPLAARARIGRVKTVVVVAPVLPDVEEGIAPAEIAAEIEAELTAWDDMDPTATEPQAFEPQEALDVMDETADEFDEEFSGEAGAASTESTPQERDERRGRRRRRRGRGRNRDAAEGSERPSTEPGQEQAADGGFGEGLESEPSEAAADETEDKTSEDDRGERRPRGRRRGRGGDRDRRRDEPFAAEGEFAAEAAGRV